MANPNLLSQNSVYASSAIISATTTATAWTALTPSANQVNRIDSILAANVSGTSTTLTVSINSAVSGGGTAYRICGVMPIPANTSVNVTDKSTSFYVGEAQSIVVTCGANNAIELLASYETAA